MRIHFAIVNVRAGIGVFRRQILERLVRCAREANNVNVLLEIGYGAPGLIGKRIELFAGKVHAPFVPETEKIEQAEDNKDQNRDGERVGAKPGRTGAEERYEISVAQG